MRGQLQQILRTSLNVVRTEKTMAAGLQQLKELENMLGEADNCYEKLRLQNDLLAATAALDGALERKTSVGCHFRADTVKEEHAYRVVIKNSGTSLALSRKSV
jgi:succinate dehydrogenase/fumarate reductase flavoprotein subunit